MGEWYETKPQYNYQLRLFRNEATGRLLAIEKDTGPRYHGPNVSQFTVRELTPGFEGRPKHNSLIVNAIDSKKTAMSEAWKYMSGNGGIG